MPRRRIARGEDELTAGKHAVERLEICGDGNARRRVIGLDLLHICRIMDRGVAKMLQRDCQAVGARFG